MDIPAFALNELFGEAVFASDLQYVLLLNENYNVAATLMMIREDSSNWLYRDVNLNGYLGKTAHVLFGAYNDGAGGVTASFVDDGSLDICP